MATITTTGRSLAAHWWVPLLRGVLAIVFGIVTFAFPISAIHAFVILFGAFAFADGVLAIAQALRFAHPDAGRWWALLLSGFAGIAIGVVTFINPLVTAATLGLFIAAWAMVTGILEIVAAFRLRRDIPGEIFMLLAGIVSVVLGLYLVLFPLGALLASVWVIATYAILAGIALIALALRLRRLGAGALA